MVETVAIIPARNGSKRLPHKNIKEICGKSMVAWVIEAVLNSSISRCIVSTENSKIKKVAKEYGAEVLDRPKELALDNVGIEMVYSFVLSQLELKENYKPDYIVALMANTPLLRSKDLNNALKILIKNNGDKIISVKEERHSILKNTFYVKNKRAKHLQQYKTHRNYYPTCYYTDRVMMIIKNNRPNEYYSLNPLAYGIDDISGIDVDTYTDFIIAERLLEERMKGENENTV